MSMDRFRGVYSDADLERMLQQQMAGNQGTRQSFNGVPFSANYGLTGGNSGAFPTGSGSFGNRMPPKELYAYAEAKRKRAEKEKKDKIIAELRRMGRHEEADRLLQEELVNQFRGVGKTQTVQVRGGGTKKNAQEKAMQDAISNNKQMESLQRELARMSKHDLGGTRARSLTERLNKLSGGAVSGDPRVAKKFFDTQKAQENQERNNAEFARKQEAAEELRNLSREYQNPAIDAEVARHMKLLNQPGVNAEDVLRSAKAAAFRAFKTEERKYQEKDKQREFQKGRQEAQFGQQDRMFDKRVAASKQAFDEATTVRKQMEQQKQVFRQVERNEQNDAQMTQALEKNIVRADAVIAGLNASIQELSREVTRGPDGSLVVDPSKQTTNPQIQAQIRQLQAQVADIEAQKESLQAEFERRPARARFATEQQLAAAVRSGMITEQEADEYAASMGWN